MFGRTAVVDIISDGRQLYDSGPLSPSDATEVYNNTVAHVESRGRKAETTVRLIQNGSILVESTFTPTL